MTLHRITTVYALPALIIPAGVLLLQVHGIPYWQHQMGAWPGLAASLTLEALALWLWFRPAPRQWFKPFAWIVTALLLWGPLNQVAGPLAVEAVQVQSGQMGTAAQLSAARAEMRDAQDAVDHLQGLLAAGRFGWQADLRSAQDRVAAAREQESALLARRAELQAQGALNWQRAERALSLALLILVLQAAVIAAINTLSAALSAVETRPVLRAVEGMADGNARKEQTAILSAADMPALSLAATPGDLSRFASGLRRQAKQFGKTYNEIAERTGVNPRDLSYAFNHDQRAKDGQRILGPEAMNRIRDQFTEAAKTGKKPGQMARGA